MVARRGGDGTVRDAGRTGSLRERVGARTHKVTGVPLVNVIAALLLAAMGLFLEVPDYTNGTAAAHEYATHHICAQPTPGCLSRTSGTLYVDSGRGGNTYSVDSPDVGLGNIATARHLGSILNSLDNQQVDVLERNGTVMFVLIGDKAIATLDYGTLGRDRAAVFLLGFTAGTMWLFARARRLTTRGNGWVRSAPDTDDTLTDVEVVAVGALLSAGAAITACGYRPDATTLDAFVITGALITGLLVWRRYQIVPQENGRHFAHAETPPHG